MSKELEDNIPSTDLERLIGKAAREGVIRSVQESLSGYHRPMSKLADLVVKRKEAELESLIYVGLDSVISDSSFKASIEEAIRSKLARCLVSSLEGEIEKRVNDLMRNPLVRARLTLALESVLNDLDKGEV